MWNNIRKLAHHRCGKWKGFVSKQNVLKAKPFVCDCWYGVSCQIWGLRARILQWFLPRIAWSDDSCHDRPSEVHFPRCGGLQAALQASPSFSWSSPQYAISDGGGEAAWHQSRLISDDYFSTASLLASPLFKRDKKWSQQMVEFAVTVGLCRKRSGG